MSMTAKDLIRPVGIPLETVDHDPVKGPSLLTLKREIGGQPIVFNQKEETLYLAGDPLTAKDWIQLRGKLDRLFIHVGAVKKAPEPNKSQPASNFLTVNLKWINEAKVGRIKHPPWFLRWLYSGVIGKEEVDFGSY